MEDDTSWMKSLGDNEGQQPDEGASQQPNKSTSQQDSSWMKSLGDPPVSEQPQPPTSSAWSVANTTPNPTQDIQNFTFPSPPKVRVSGAADLVGAPFRSNIEYPHDRGSLSAFLSGAGNMMAYGAGPYERAALQDSPKAFNQRVALEKRYDEETAKAHPWASTAGTVAGLIPSMFTGSGEVGAARTLATPFMQAAGYGLTQGGSGLEDWASGKADASKPLVQAGLGALTAVPGVMLGSLIDPRVARDAPAHAYNAGVSLAADYLNPKAAQKTVQQVVNRVRDFAGDINPEHIAQNAYDTFVHATVGAPAAAPIISYFNQAIQRGHSVMDAITHMDPSQIARFMGVVRASSPETAAQISKGYVAHVADAPSGWFNFDQFANNWGSSHPDTRNILLSGNNAATQFLHSLKGLRDSTMSSAGNALDYASGLMHTPSGGRGGGGAMVDTALALMSPALLAKKKILGTILEGVRKGTGAVANAAGARNIAYSPAQSTIRRGIAPVVERGAASYLPSYVAPITGGIHSGIQGATHSILNPEAEKWYQEHMPWILGGGKASGGRTAYKSGGKVSSGIEPLVQNLMSGYKKAKAAEVATTKPLLQHSDQTIVRALRVAKKAI